MKLILASKSPRRIEMLKNLGLSPEIMPAEVDENIDGFKGVPDIAVTTLAKRKALAISQKTDGNCIIIAADTLVYKGNTLLGKPKDENDAFRMLKALSDDRHSVYTGFAVAYGGKLISRCVETKVIFKDLSDDEINSYISSGEPMDKAGAYGIQGKGALFVKGIDGDYFNVVGLPLCALFEAIKEEFGIDIEDIR